MKLSYVLLDIRDGRFSSAYSGVESIDFSKTEDGNEAIDMIRFLKAYCSIMGCQELRGLGTSLLRYSPNEIAFWPYADLLRRIAGQLHHDNEAMHLKEMAMGLGCGEAVLVSSDITPATFVPHFDYLESNMAQILGERVK